MTDGPQRRARVLVVEDHPLLIDGLRWCLDAEGYEVVVAPLDNPEAVVDAGRRLRPDVVLLDVELGETIGDGADLVAPLTKLGATVIVVSGTTQTARIGLLVERGAAGFVPKSRSMECLVAAVANAVDRRPLMSDAERSRLRAALQATRRRNGALERLSPREAAILADLADGKTAPEVAKGAYVSEGTVRTQIRSILTKLDVKSQLAAVVLAHKAGWRPRG